MLWADESHFKKFYFTQASVSQEFRNLLKFLEKADLNKMGPLIDLNYALSGWDAKNKHGRYLYHFSFEWS